MKDYSLEESNTKSINRGGLLVLSSDTEMMTASTTTTTTSIMKNGKVNRIHIPRDAVAIQVGEAAAILTGGRLKACLHCVARPRAGTHLLHQRYTRQTFVLFAQPPWSQSMQALNVSLFKEGAEKGEKDSINSIYDYNDELVITGNDSLWKESSIYGTFSDVYDNRFFSNLKPRLLFMDYDAGSKLYWFDDYGQYRLPSRYIVPISYLIDSNSVTETKISFRQNSNDVYDSVTSTTYSYYDNNSYS
jgi:hypothetical protein